MLAESNESYWQLWLESAEKTFADFDKMTADVAESFTNSFGDAFEDVVMNSTSVRDAVGNLAQGIAGSMVNAIGKMAAQWLILQMVRKTADSAAQAAAATTMTANAQAQSMMAGLAAFASTAAIPIVGPAAAPAAATAAIAATQPMALAVSGLMLAGMAHDGIDSVPKTGTWLLEKGERVLTSETSAKLDKRLEGGMGGGVVVNLFEDSAKAGQVDRKQTDDGRQQVDIFVSDIMSNGPRSKSLESAYGLRRQGR
jgi:hypothetical protein